MFDETTFRREINNKLNNLLGYILIFKEGKKRSFEKTTTVTCYNKKYLFIFLI